MLISSKEWQNWYKKTHNQNFFDIKVDFSQKWIKESSLNIAEQIRIQYGWDIGATNHDEADSLLIGWYYLNKENK